MCVPGSGLLGAHANAGPAAKEQKEHNFLHRLTASRDYEEFTH
jgi:hypothetical protein